MKKILCIVIVGCIAFLNFNSIFSYAAGNTVDRHFKLVAQPGYDKADYDVTEWRSKKNASAVYMKVNYIKFKKHKLIAWVQGLHGLSARNCSGGKYYKISSKKTYKLTNYVKEMNLNNARIKVGADPGNPNRIEGVWSPDSKR